MASFSKVFFDLRDLKPHGHDVGGLVFGPVAVSCCDDRTIGEYFDSRIGAIAALVILLEQNSVIAGCALYKVFVAPDPSDPAIGRRTGVALARNISE